MRRQATRAVARSPKGAQRLIDLAKKNQLADELKSSAAFHLNASNDTRVRTIAAKLFPLPATKGDKPLPPISALIRSTGDATRGMKAFATVGQCSKCHVVNKEGKEVGPNLSEIGGKLSKQALFESILYPSAGVAHNYETYSLVLNNGLIVKGVLVSKTADKIRVKTEDAIIREYELSDVDEVIKSRQSIMPADLQKILSTQELIDVVSYLSTLKKAK